MPTFGTYDLSVLRENPVKLYELGASVIIKIADAFNYELPAVPTEESLFGLIGAVGPNRELQANIDYVQRVLGPNAVKIAADWLEDAGVMNAMSGSFWNPSGEPMPDEVGAIIWSGGVANWLERRLKQTLEIDPYSVHGTELFLPMGTRHMKAEEHQLVRTWIAGHGQEPLTEHDYVEKHFLPRLLEAEFDAEVIEVKSSNGDTVCEAVFRKYPDLLESTILTIGNAPHTIQCAGQLRAAARRLNPNFDRNGNQLFMIGDYFPIARHGEPKGTHQNPLSGITQLVRNAAFLMKALTED